MRPLNLIISCPFESTCNWSGSASNLENHFEEAHPNYVAKNSTFTLQTKPTHHAYLLPIEGRNFLLKMRSEPRRKKKITVVEVLLCLQFIGRRKDVKDLVYFVELLDGNECIQRFSSKEIDVAGNETHLLKFSVLQEHVAVPAEPIVVNSTVVEYYTTSEMFFFHKRHISACSVRILENPNKRFEQLNSVLLQNLECPICMELMQGLIRNCPYGHIFCQKCSLRITNCPICRKSCRNFNRNLFAENVAERVLKTCRYSTNGCTFLASNIQAHENRCPVRNISCPVKYLHPTCTWTGMTKEILPHMQNAHRDNVLEMAYVVIPLSVNNSVEDDRDCFVFEAYGEVFRLLYKCERGMFNWALQLVGPSYDYEQFEYVLTVVTSEESKCKLTLSFPCIGYGRVEDIVSWLMCPLSSIRPMVDENMNLTYRIEVVRI